MEYLISAIISAVIALGASQCVAKQCFYRVDQHMAAIIKKLENVIIDNLFGGQKE